MGRIAIAFDRHFTKADQPLFGVLCGFKCRDCGRVSAVAPEGEHLAVKLGNIGEMPIERAFGCAECAGEFLGFEGCWAMLGEGAESGQYPVFGGEAFFGVWRGHAGNIRWRIDLGKGEV